MGQQTSTQTVQTTPANSQENAIIAALQQIMSQSSGQLGDLGNLAAGKIGGPTAEDKRLVQESIGLTADTAEKQMRAVLDRLGANLDESLAAKGIQGSSIEGFQQAGLRQQGLQDILAMVNQSRQEGANTLLNLPFQRANTQIGANQALFQRIAGASQPALSALLQSRLTNQTQTTKQPMFTGGDFLKLGGLAAGL
jgi:hypothetical protein